VTGESLGLLIEESRTNLAKYSEQFDQGFWVKLSSNTSVTPNATTSPDGTNSADLVTATASALLNGDLVYQEVQNQSNKDLVGSIYVKSSGSANIARFFVNGNAGADRQILDVTLTNEWQRVVLPVFNTTQANAYIHVKPGDEDGLLKSFYIWGAQLEEGSFATSYIPTSGSTVTRAADVASITGTNFSSWYNQSEGTVFVDTQSYPHPVSGKALVPFAFSDNSYSNRITLPGSTGSSQFNFDVTAGGILQRAVLGNFLSSGLKAAGGYKSTGSAGSLDGATAVTSNSPNIPSVISQLDIGQAQDGTNTLNGHISRLAYYPYRLADATLQEITS
jgi:hypothetical protein